MFSDFRYLIQAKDNVQKLLEWIGTIFSLLYFITPAIQIVRVFLGKSSKESVPLFLLLSIIFNCLFWIIHGTKNGNSWVTLFLSNGVGFLVNISLLYSYLYIFLNKQIKYFLFYSVFILNLLIEITYLIYRYVFLGHEDKDNSYTIGFVATIVNVIMYASPLTNVFQLFKTGNHESLPIITNLFGFFATLFWMIYGIKQNYSDTIVSNGVSLGFVSIQILLWAFFYFKGSNNEEQSDFQQVDAKELN